MFSSKIFEYSETIYVRNILAKTLSSDHKSSDISVAEGHTNPQYLQSMHVKPHRYRRNGIRHVEECHEFEVARARRDKKKENKKKAVSICMVSG